MHEGVKKCNYLNYIYLLININTVWKSHIYNELEAIELLFYVCVWRFIIAGTMGYYAFNANEIDKELCWYHSEVR